MCQTTFFHQLSAAVVTFFSRAAPRCAAVGACGGTLAGGGFKFECQAVKCCLLSDTELQDDIR